MRFRSLLYVPASSERFIAKAHERGADAIILDLEDSVVPAEKQAARERLLDAVPMAGRNGAKVFVRINSEPGLQKADALAACQAGAFGLYIAKTQSPDQLHILASHVEPIERQIGRDEISFVPLLEDAGAVLEARAIARFRRVVGLATGGEDLAAGMGAEPLPEVLRLPKLMVHLAAKAEGKLSFGTLSTIADYSNLESVGAAAREAKAHGFDGASCIHPSAVSILNAAFSPSVERIAWARTVVEAAAAAEAGGRGAFVLDGTMVDAPIVARARRILDEVSQ
ncbi:citrate lyase subunit beta/citryl-CoA lyase [Pararhizobium capsulatum DSM 1112]|uniref:Citrate lyase subunit beta/citryl-CoA lyase n=1 Tax=Pararhizobium capsulatum DSM 1112 TaxID=1121113 RepID=A0ABU0BYL0_9HYPH|nr:CoA ester lyase [Pararhizobium capsulatum]MDQ0323356.1 citrate lyase subunit beta/citryl-CoA lyase [Pararhizobium capsulatum DSM 1112]